MENKLTSSGVVQRTEASAPSHISPTLSHFCPPRAIIFFFFFWGREGNRHTAPALPQHLYADCRIFVPSCPSASIKVNFGAELGNMK